LDHMLGKCEKTNEKADFRPRRMRTDPRLTNENPDGQPLVAGILVKDIPTADKQPQANN
jgi:hypothetical protein